MKQKEILHKIISFINRIELDFLDEIIYDIYFSIGKKVSRAYVIRTIIKMAKKSQGFNKEIIQQITEDLKKERKND